MSPGAEGPPPQTGVVGDALRLDVDEPDAGLKPLEGPRLVTIAHKRENTRASLAWALVVLMALVYGVTYYAVFAGKDAAVFERLLDKIGGPLAALVGTVIGFYFGAASTDSTK